MTNTNRLEDLADSGSTLDKLLALQRDFMDVLGIPREAVASLDDKRVVGAALGLASEAGEVCQELNVGTRVWADAPFDTKRALLGMEAIDIFFYLLELFLLLGFTQEAIVGLYVNKLDRNLERVLEFGEVNEQWELASALKGAINGGSDDDAC